MQNSQPYSTGPFENLNPPKWPFIDIIWGISIPSFILIYNIFLVYFTPFMNSAPGLIFFLSIYILTCTLMFVYPIYICKKRQFWPLFSITNIQTIVKEFCISFLYWLLIGIVLGLILTIITVTFGIPAQPSLMGRYISHISNNSILLIIIIYISILGPIIEEIFFRGFLYNSMKTHFPVWLAVVFQAAFFSFIHDPNDLMKLLSTFMIGIALALVYESRGTLLSPIFIHIIINSLWSIRAMAGIRN
jgi:membrane protease YdiL (CAAX protease family)